MNRAEVRKNLQKINSKVASLLEVEYYSSSEIQKRLEQFSVKNPAVLIDDETDWSELKKLQEFKVAGFYSDQISCIDLVVDHGSGSTKVQALTAQNILKNGDGWIISARKPTSYYALVRYLEEIKKPQQTIVWHAHLNPSTPYYSYIDFIQNAHTTTKVQVMNYFDFCYRYSYPLDLRFTLRKQNGSILQAGQRIVPRNGLTVFNSSELVDQDFLGYLEIEFNVPQKVANFLHYNADYFSAHTMAANHQSGFSMHRAHSQFTRGLIPTERDLDLEVAVFQRNYSEPVAVKATVQYYVNNTEQRHTQNLTPLNQGQMNFYNIKKIFKEIDFSQTQVPSVIIESNVALHRPNYYYKNGQQEIYNVEHAGPDPKNYCKGWLGEISTISENEVKKSNELNCVPLELCQAVWPAEYKISSSLIFSGDINSEFNELQIDFHDPDGKLLTSKQQTWNHQKNRELNINDWLSEAGLQGMAGTLALRAPANQPVPLLLGALAGFKHHNQNYRATTVARGVAYEGVSLSFEKTITEQFARGIANQEFDTYCLFTNRNANRSIQREVEYEVQLHNDVGKKAILYRKIAAQGIDAFKLSDLIRQTQLESITGRYTIWVATPYGFLNGQHILYRKSDSAIAAEHFYWGRV